MANPNIVAVTEILGESVGAIATTSFVNIVTNTASSGKVYKINSLIATNIDTVNTQDISVNYVSGGTSYALARNISIPLTSSLVAIAKDSGIYLNEGDSIAIKATVASVVEVVCSYEIIS
jgi:hypothetical protein